MKTTTFMLLFWGCAHAVVINPEGQGQALVIPYYTVNQHMNTLVTVTNHQDVSKAIKVTIKAGKTGHPVFSHNVYLSPHDAWSFGMAGLNQSLFPGHEDEPSAILFTADESCAPFLIKSGSEFVPHDIGGEVQSMALGREGFIEIIEMGTLDAPVSQWAQVGNAGVPLDCAALQAAFDESDEDAIWNATAGGDLQQHMLPPTGGLSAEANLIDVFEGRNHAYDAIAFDGFFKANETHHSRPDVALSLTSAVGEDTAWLFDGQHPVFVQAEDARQALSATLMVNQSLATYDLEPAVNGQTEVVHVLPLFNWQDNASHAACVDGLTPASMFEWRLFNRSGQLLSESVSPTPQCTAQLVTSVVMAGGEQPPSPAITGSAQFVRVELPAGSASVAGQLVFSHSQPQQLTVTQPGAADTWQVTGVPVLGLVLQSYTNANASEGLLAQYASAVPVFTQTGMQQVGAARQSAQQGGQP